MHTDTDGHTCLSLNGFTSCTLCKDCMEIIDNVDAKCVKRNFLLWFFCSIGRHSKSLDIATKRCGHCYGMFELLLNTRRKSGTIAQHTLKKRSPVGFARFVKENYSSVKQSRTDLRHGDVMRLLGQQFSAVKIGSEARKQ